jgi:hypothetical protein
LDNSPPEVKTNTRYNGENNHHDSNPFIFTQLMPPNKRLHHNYLFSSFLLPRRFSVAAFGAEVILVFRQEKSQRRQQAAYRPYQTTNAANTAKKFQHVSPHFYEIHR